jgi:Phosphatidylserine decarboxylase
LEARRSETQCRSNESPPAGPRVRFKMSAAEYSAIQDSSPDPFSIRDCHVEHVTHICGDTWNVNPIALARVEKLFCRNERVIIRTRGEATGELVTMVPVAAILVAGIRLPSSTSSSTRDDRRLWRFAARSPSEKDKRWAGSSTGPPSLSWPQRARSCQTPSKWVQRFAWARR